MAELARRTGTSRQRILQIVREEGLWTPPVTEWPAVDPSGETMSVAEAAAALGITVKRVRSLVAAADGRLQGAPDDSARVLMASVAYYRDHRIARLKAPRG
jgi:hypothetical protein